MEVYGARFYGKDENGYKRNSTARYTTRSWAKLKEKKLKNDESKLAALKVKLGKFHRNNRAPCCISKRTER